MKKLFILAGVLVASLGILIVNKHLRHRKRMNEYEI